MNAGAYHHIGGVLYRDQRRISLASARALLALWAADGSSASSAGASPGCAARDQLPTALRKAVASALAWRRAAGWDDPNQADG